jgi:hypothetical protein
MKDELNRLLSGLVDVSYNDTQGEAINALLNSGTRPYNLTGVPLETLTAIGRAACEVPEWCTPAESRKRRVAPGLHDADNPLAPRIRRERCVGCSE